MKTKQERKNSVKNKIFHTQEWRIIMKTDVIKTAVKENKKNKMAVLCRKVKENIILRLTALFHDIGKPYTYTKDENNIGHFYNHWIKSCEIFLNFSKKYELPDDLTYEVKKLIYYHDINISKLNREELNKFLDEFSVDEINMLYEIKKSDLLAQSPKYHYLLDEYALQKENLLMKKIPK